MPLKRYDYTTTAGVGHGGMMGMDGLDRSSGRLDAQQDTVDKIPQILKY